VWWLFAAAAVIGASILIVAVTDMRPGYDGFGWLVWGHQVLYGSLNTDGAPSWKPLTFLFTLPYALAGYGQMWLWMVTAVAGALAGCVFAARIAYRLTGPSGARAYAPLVAAAFAGAGILVISGYTQQILIANSDPIVATLCLAAIDCHLHKRPRLAFAMLVLASLGRPEAAPFAVLYALWSWRAVPSMRLWAPVGIALIPALWFVISGLTSKSWFTASDLALSSVNSRNVVHGNKFTGVIDRFGGLDPWPTWLAAVTGIGLGLRRRDRELLALAAAACLWVAIEIAFVLHGFTGAARYLFEPAAVVVVIAGAAVGRVLAYAPRRPRGLGLAGAVAVVALLVALAPTVRQRARLAHGEVSQSHADARLMNRLEAVIAKDGGATRILACGQPVTPVGQQSKVAWAVGLNVGNVGFRPGRSIDRGTKVVVLKPHDVGWQVRPFNMHGATAARCNRLKTDSAFG
jgi:hypothetical protein